MTAREFYRAVVNMRKAQRDCEKLNYSRNRILKSEAERIVDAEIERVEQALKEEAENQQLKML